LRFEVNPQQIVKETLSRENPSHKRVDRVTQGVGPEFIPQYYKTTTKPAKLRLEIQLSGRVHA
jgi:hypothetical protein